MGPANRQNKTKQAHGVNGRNGSAAQVGCITRLETDLVDVGYEETGDVVFDIRPHAIQGARNRGLHVREEIEGRDMEVQFFEEAGGVDEVWDIANLTPLIAGSVVL